MPLKAYLQSPQRYRVKPTDKNRHLSSQTLLITPDQSCRLEYTENRAKRLSCNSPGQYLLDRKILTSQCPDTRAFFVGKKRYLIDKKEIGQK